MGQIKVTNYNILISSLNPMIAHKSENDDDIVFKVLKIMHVFNELNITLVRPCRVYMKFAEPNTRKEATEVITESID